MLKGNEKRPIAPTSIEIQRDPLSEKAFLEGVCFKPRSPELVVDTIILHSCCVPNEVIEATEFVPEVCSEEAARALAAQWQSSGDSRYEVAAIHTLVRARRGDAGLQPFCVDAIKDIFEFYGVSAHYLIEPRGAVREFVEPSMLAFHAGASVMPRAEDGRCGVNGFSIGIELLATPESGYREEQLLALTLLVDQLMARFPIENLYGHSDIAPERKTDPWGFEWSNFVSRLQRAPRYTSAQQ